MELSKRIGIAMGLWAVGFVGMSFADRMLLDFERNRDLNVWEVHEGDGLEMTTEGALEGQRSLEVPTDTHMSTSMLPRDWSGYTYLVVEVFNPFKTPVSMSIVLGDGEWLDRKHYWNRHNRFELIEPGRQTLRIPLAQLYRGEVDRRNIDLPNNLNVAEIVRLEFEIKGQVGAILLDNIRLAGEGVASHGAPRTATPSRASAPTAQPEVKMLSDFESVRDALLWEKRTGWFDPVVVEDSARGQGKSLKVAPDSLLSNLSLAGNWTGYSMFEFDVFVEAEKLITLELMIGDAAWGRAQHYYNRHNSLHRLLPGKNTIQLSLTDLYRGERSKRNTMLPRNIDVDAIQQVNLKVHGGEGFIYLDQFRLTGATAILPAVPRPVVAQPRVQIQAVPRPYSAPVAHAGEKLVNGFESIREVLSWEKREGWFDCEISSEHVTQGAHSMKMATGTLLTSHKMPRDWSGWDSLELDIFNASERILTLECMVGDDAWTRKQSYYNRHNSVHRLAPGPNTIRLDLVSLYRGELQKRNSDIPSNIDLSTIVQMNLKLLGAEGFAYLDRLQFVGSGMAITGGTVPERSSVVRSVQRVQAAQQNAVLKKGRKLLSGLESVRDVVGWELREGWFDPVQSKEHVVEGESSLKIAAQTLLVNNSLSSDWSGYGFLELSIFNSGSKAVKLELMIGDRAWNQRQSYYNRHNSVHTLLPGGNDLKLDLSDLYRGEPQRRNSDISRNIDLHEITQVNLRFMGEDEFVFLDHVVLSDGLEGEPQAVVAPVPVVIPKKRLFSVTAKLVAPVVVVEDVPPKATKVWNDFESLRESAAFEVRRGAAELAELHAVGGEQSLRLQPGTLIATYQVPSDWRGYEALEFDFFYEGAGVAKLEVMVGDKAWTQQQTYWNRYNQVFPILPGSNTISIAVDDLFRGEPASRNREIPRNVDVDSIVQFNLWIKGGTGLFYLDSCRMKGGADGEGSIEVAEFGATEGVAKNKKIFGFEDQREVVSWELRQGPEIQWVDHKASEGSHSLQMESTSLIANYSFPTDWSSYELLEFDVWLEGEGLVKMELMIGDQAWTEKQTYWNRHNGIWPLVPGSNHVEIALDGLYRGEPGSRNREVARNIDLDQIRQVNIGCIGGEGSLFLDDFRLTAGGDERAEVKAFDFGPEDQAVWSGFNAVTWNTVYTAEKGFGFERSQPRKKNAGSANFPTRLFQDYVHVEQGEFLVDVPKGDYQVFVWFEDAGYWGGEHAKFSYRSISAEAKDVVIEDRREQGVHDDAWFRFLDFEPVPGKHALRGYFDSLYGPREFSVAVDDGQLNILPWSDGAWSTRISSVVIIPKGNAASARWVDELIEKNYKEFASRAVMLPYPKANRLVEEHKGPVVFAADPNESFALNFLPAPVRLEKGLVSSGVWGESVPFTFGVHLPDRSAEVTFELANWRKEGGEVKKVSLAMYEVRHLAKRSYEDLSYQIKPWFLRPYKPRNLEQGKTRQFWFSVPISESWSGGFYSSELSVYSGGKKVSVLPIRLEIIPVMPERLDFPVALMGMPKDALSLLGEYGFTAVSGGVSVPIPVVGKGGRVDLSLDELNSYLTTGHEAGLNQGVIDYGGPFYLQGLSYRQVEKYFERLGQSFGLSALQVGQKVFEELQEEAKALGYSSVVLNLADEPKSIDEVKDLVASAKFLKAAAPEVKLAGFFSYNPEKDHLGLGRLWEEMDILITKGVSDSFLEESLEAGKEVYLYSLGRNRHTFGPVLWKHRQRGIRGYIQWHSSLIHGYQGFDLDGREPDMGLLIRHPEGYWPTLELEHIRQGLLDLRIFSSLSLQQKRVAEPLKGRILKLLNEVRSGVDGGMDLREMRIRAAKLLLEAKAY